MKIRGKLLLLLLVIALVPLIFSAVLNQFALHRLGDRLTADTRRFLDQSSRNFLQTKVEDYQIILQRDRQTLHLALDYQAREVEERLAGPSPRPAPVYLAADYDRANPPPPGLKPSDRHFRTAPDGSFQPMQTSLEEQVILLVEKPSPRLKADLARMSTLTEAYRRINRVNPELFYWQYTALETGIHSSYPGHGGYPANYDPRRRSWYLKARERGKTVWEVVTDATSGKPILTMARPVYRPDGHFAGVTAIDIAYEQMFAAWKLPKNLSEASDSMVAVLRKDDAGGAKIVILLRSRQPGSSEDWQRPPRRERFESPDREELAALQQDLLEGRSGVREMSWHGRESLVAYSPGDRGEPFPLVVVPLELLHAPAVRMENYLHGRIVDVLQLSIYLLLGVVAWVVLTAYVRSRMVTRPIKELAAAAESLAKGDYAVKVRIDTGDELQALGETFNRVGPQLQEREVLKQSLLVAREIQQMLLPATAPRLHGFDIAGRTLYCDETGGDYFDYIPIDARRLAVVVGDVTGHGIGSALLMAAARGVLRSQSTPHNLAADRLLGDLNRHLVRDTSDTLFMTLFYGLLDADRREFNWVSAGHGPAFHYRDGHFEELPSTGIPLGILAETDFDRRGPLRVDPDDILLIGTDGIWEAQSPDGGMFGIERLQQVVAATAALPAAHILEAVLEAVGGFRGPAPQKDDLTLLVIKGREPSLHGPD